MIFGILFVLCIIIGVPIFACLGVPPTFELLKAGSAIPITTLAHSLFTGVDKFPLLAIPCFVLAGSIMSRAGITAELINVMQAAIGRLPGGLAIVTIMSCMFFAAISGSGPGTVAAVGSLLIPAMHRDNYDIDFASAVASSGGTLGILIPPSNPMIVYGVLASVSISDLFMAGIVPGALIGLLLILTALFISYRRGYASGSEHFGLMKLLKAVWQAKFSLFTPFLVLGGIYLGIFTPVEASVIAVLYALFVGVVIKKSIGIKLIWEAFSEASVICGGLVLIMGTAIFFGQYMALNQIPNKIAAYILSITHSPYVLLLIICFLLLILGMFMETLSTVIILTPILLPLMKKLGIDPIHFGVLFVVTNEVGFLTPPLGVNLFVACSISKRPIESISRKVIPFIIAIVIGLLIILFYPKICLFLPDLLRK